MPELTRRLPPPFPLPPPSPFSFPGTPTLMTLPSPTHSTTARPRRTRSRRCCRASRRRRVGYASATRAGSSRSTTSWPGTPPRSFARRVLSCSTEAGARAEWRGDWRGTGRGRCQPRWMTESPVAAERGSADRMLFARHSTLPFCLLDLPLLFHPCWSLKFVAQLASQLRVTCLRSAWPRWVASTAARRCLQIGTDVG